LLILILPLAFLLLLWGWRRAAVGWRVAFLAASATWAVGLLSLTELLSAFHELTRFWIASGWITLCIASLLFILRLPAKMPAAVQGSPLSEFKGLDLLGKILLLSMVAILSVTLLVAIISPPNTDDVMEYHLPRVAMWAGNQSVQFFPTFDFSQLIHAPWAEYAALHVYLLSGSDRCINLIEWFSFLACILGASLIAKLLGATLRGQILAAVLCATLPELILESTGSNNTAVGAFWIVGAIAILLSRGELSPTLRASLAGICIGLAILTKGTAVVLLPPLLAATWLILRPRMSSRLLGHAALLAAAVVLINLPQGVRNVRLTGTPLGLPFPEAGNRLRFRSEVISPSVVVSGVLRNAALHLGTPSRQFNSHLEHLLRRVIQAAGADPDDPRTTWRDTFRIPATTTREYFAGSPGQFLLLCAVFVWTLLHWRSANRGTILLFLAIALAFVLFSASMKWNLSAARYHLPLFVIGAGLLGATLPSICRERVLAAIALVALLASTPFVFANSLRSLVPSRSTFLFRASRDSLYFADDFREPQVAQYSAAADEVQRSSCKEVGIDAMLQTYVYPMIALVHERVPAARFQYVGVTNLTSNYAVALHRPNPCVVVCLGCMHVANKWTRYRNWQLGDRVSIFGDIAVFWPGGALLNDANEHVKLSELAPQELLALAEQNYARLQAIPLPSGGKMTRVQPTDNVLLDFSEIQLRALRIWEWSEPLRNRARTGTATPADIDTLETIDEALPELEVLLHQKIGVSH
jgi:hypothetical protein